MSGIPNVRTRVNKRLVEDEEWTIVPAHTLTGFDHEPRPPFRWQLLQAGIPVATAGLTQTGVFETLDEVMNYFADEMLPPKSGLAAMVVDESYRIILGWSMPKWAEEQYGQAAWMGTAAGFTWLAESGRFKDADVEAWRLTAEMYE